MNCMCSSLDCQVNGCRQVKDQQSQANPYYGQYHPLSQTPMQQGLGAYSGMPPAQTVSRDEFNELKSKFDALEQRVDELTKDKS